MVFGGDLLPLLSRFHIVVSFIQFENGLLLDFPDETCNVQTRPSHNANPHPVTDTSPASESDVPSATTPWKLSFPGTSSGLGNPTRSLTHSTTPRH